MTETIKPTYYVYELDRLTVEEESDVRVKLVNSISQICYDLAEGNLTKAAELFKPITDSLEENIRNYYELHLDGVVPLSDYLEITTNSRDDLGLPIEGEDDYYNPMDSDELILARCTEACHRFFKGI